MTTPPIMTTSQARLPLRVDSMDGMVRSVPESERSIELSSRPVPLPGFHLIPLALAPEDAMLAAALDELEAVSPGEVAFLPEYLARTPEGSGRAFARLLRYAQANGIDIITTL